MFISAQECFVREIAIHFVGLFGNSDWPNHNGIDCVVPMGNSLGMKYTCSTSPLGV